MGKAGTLGYAPMGLGMAISAHPQLALFPALHLLSEPRKRLVYGIGQLPVHFLYIDNQVIVTTEV